MLYIERQEAPWGTGAAMRNTKNTRPRLGAVLCVASSLACFAALACTVPPPTLFRSPESLVAEANSIALVEAVAAPDASCSLRVLQSWKATPPPTIASMCRLAEADHDWMTDFSEHMEGKFWKQGQGRLGVAGDCSVVAPGFTPGHRYLLFFGIVPDLKSAEDVSAPGDRWLEYVRKNAKQ